MSRWPTLPAKRKKWEWNWRPLAITILWKSWLRLLPFRIRTFLPIVLLRLAAQNIGRRLTRSLFLGLAIMIAVGVGFSGAVLAFGGLWGVLGVLPHDAGRGLG